MRRWLEAPTGRLAGVLALVVGAALATMLPSLMAGEGDPRSALLAAALVVAVAAFAGRCGLLLSSPHMLAAAHATVSDDAVACRTGGVTDPPRHPLRPRAPGQV